MKIQNLKISFFISFALFISIQLSATAETLTAYKAALGISSQNKIIRPDLTVDVLVDHNPTWESYFFSELVQIPEKNIQWIVLKDELAWSLQIEKYKTATPVSLVVNLTSFSQDKYKSILDQAMTQSLWIQINSKDLFKHSHLIQIMSHDMNESLKYQPDIWGPSVIAWNQQVLSGSKVTTLAAAALTMIAITQKGILNKEQILQSIGGRSFSWLASGLPTSALGFQWTGPQCFITFPKAFDTLPEFIKIITYRGGRLVQTTAGGRIIFPNDPIKLTQLTRFQFDDMLTLSPRGFELAPRGGIVEPDQIEIFQRPLEASPCNLGSALSGRYLELSL